jgi:hypothetical protein
VDNPTVAKQSNSTYLTMRGEVRNGDFVPSGVEINHYPDRTPVAPGSVEESQNEMHLDCVLGAVAEFLGEE